MCVCVFIYIYYVCKYVCLMRSDVWMTDPHMQAAARSTIN